MTVTTIPTASATGAWAGTDQLPAAARWDGQHDGAVTIDDAGTVLVAGGADASGAAVRQAAIYDPAHGTWTAVGDLTTPRRLHALTLLPDGKVLATGGLSGADDGGPGLASAEVYDPAKKSWTATNQPMAEPRWGHSAVLLDNGTVLVAGGTGVRAGLATHALRSAERFDPGTGDPVVTGTWAAAGSLTDARTGHTALVLAGGAVLVCGGTAPVGAAADPALAFCELYDTTGDTWTPTGSLTHARAHHNAVALSDHKVLITGGSAPGAPGGGPFDPFSQRTAELYDLDTGSWKPARDMPAGRSLHRAAVLAGGTVLVVGGAASDRDEAGYRSAVTYDPAHDTWTPVAGLADGRWSFVIAALPAGTVLVAGGVERSGLAAADPATTELTRTSEVFTPGTGS
jgi:N-acetylneuraminic acid mutarotase